MRFEGRVWKSKTSKYWLIEVPMLDIVTQGESKEDAFVMIKDAIEEMVHQRGFRISVFPGDGNEFTIGANQHKALVAFMLKQQRAKKHLNVREVAKRLHSASPNAYAQYEQGKVAPSLDKLIELLHAINPEAKPVLKMAS